MSTVATDAREPRRHTLAVNGLELAAWEWEGHGAPILLVHATGFHALCWAAVARRLPGRHVFALDMPSHGASARKPPPYDWTHFGDDLAGAIEALDLKHLTGVGHSMGGHAMVLAAAKLPARFRGLLLADPVITDPEYSRKIEGRIRAADHPISRRRNRWDSPAHMEEVFAAKEPYSRWDREVLHDYCVHGLVPAEDGAGFELACPPNLEAEVYAGMHMRDIYRVIPRVTVPVDIIRARDRRADETPFDFAPSPTWSKVAAEFANARDEQLSGRTHFFPMEIPGWMAARIAAFADSLRPL
jgi:pimeloyl-ACP methyl ester carboxylesterase